MSRSMVVNYEGEPCYEIVIEPDFGRLAEKIRALGYQKEQRICVITDTNVAPLYLEEVTAELKKCCNTVLSFTFPAGEENKNVDTISQIYQTLIDAKFDRKDILAALGGGVVGDMCGFAAATYLRGIDFIQIPTTLLAQVDSSIGGKTGVDFQQYKNMVGAFYMPRLVYMNLSTLNTLPDDHFCAGMAEILKHGLIKDADYFEWLKKHRDAILNHDPAVLEDMIAQSCRIKKAVVENDPKEKGERALLNFGHTAGHAVEKLSDFSLIHGYCVAIGIAAACALSAGRNLISQDTKNEILSVLRQFHLPTSVDNLSATDILSATKLDKKMESGKIKFILLQSVGSAFIDKSVSDDELFAAIQSIMPEIMEESASKSISEDVTF